MLTANFVHLTGAVSGSNFSIPFFPRYESSGFNESNANLEPRKNKRDSNDGWQIIDLSDRAKSVSPSITTEPKGGESQAGIIKEKMFYTNILLNIKRCRTDKINWGLRKIRYKAR